MGLSGLEVSIGYEFSSAGTYPQKEGEIMAATVVEGGKGTVELGSDGVIHLSGSPTSTTKFRTPVQRWRPRMMRWRR